MRILNFDEFQEVNAQELNCILAETGADRELDFDPEREIERIFNKTLHSNSLIYVKLPLTQFEIYNTLHHEMTLKLAFRNMYPEGEDIFQCSRIAHIYTVQNTWYWFNNQEEFVKNINFISLKYKG